MKKILKELFKCTANSKDHVELNAIIKIDISDESTLLVATDGHIVCFVILPLIDVLLSVSNVEIFTYEKGGYDLLYTKKTWNYGGQDIHLDVEHILNLIPDQTPLPMLTEVQQCPALATFDPKYLFIAGEIADLYGSCESKYFHVTHCSYDASPISMHSYISHGLFIGIMPTRTMHYMDTSFSKDNLIDTIRGLK